MSKGRELSKELGISCKQALFSEWGNFYAPIKGYPCVLFDKEGFIVINSPNELERLGVKLGKRTNVPALISSSPTYQLISAWRVKLAEEVSNIDSRIYSEGKVVSINVNRYERDQTARSKCLAHYGYTCKACGLKLSTIYGSVAKEFIHVHHIIPISSIGREYQLDPIRDLKPLCPNCHAIAHLRNDPYSIVEIQEMFAISKQNNHNIDESQ